MNANASKSDSLRQPGDFVPVGFNVYFPESNPWPRQIVRLSDAVRAWDGMESRFAVYSDLYDVYLPCKIDVTGRGVRFISNGTYQLTVRVMFENEGPDGYEYDGERQLGNVLLTDPRDLFTIEAAKAALTN